MHPFNFYGFLNDISLEDLGIDQDNMFALMRIFSTVTCLLDNKGQLKLL